MGPEDALERVGQGQGCERRPRHSNLTVHFFGVLRSESGRLLDRSTNAWVCALIPPWHNRVTQSVELGLRCVFGPFAPNCGKVPSQCDLWGLYEDSRVWDSPLAQQS